MAVGILKQHSYDPNQRRCMAFTKYPCKSKTNIFQSISQCRLQCQLQPVHGGPSPDKGKNFYFSPSKRSCQVYNGVKCTDNNLYTTPIECQESCIGKNQEICNLPRVIGPCKAALPKWYFDRSLNKCVKFIYGGCSGNSNNFETRDECLANCKDEKGASLIAGQNFPSVHNEGPCELPKDSGPCEALVKRYYYNKALGKCEIFNYGGCKGNSNNFKTSQECVARCKFVPVR